MMNIWEARKGAEHQDTNHASHCSTSAQVTVPYETAPPCFLTISGTSSSPNWVWVCVWVGIKSYIYVN